MSHKKCPISEVFLKLIHRIPLSFFVWYINLVYVQNFEPFMSKASHLNFSLNTHFFVMNISSVNPYFLVHNFCCYLTGNAFWHI
jgi:hypothetical protein